MRALAVLAINIAAVGSSTGCTQAAAQSSPPPCAGPGYAQLDFWVGTWNVTAGGKLAGKNRIEKVLENCALLENWESVGKHRGHSLTFYDAPRDLWHQTWIDVAGQPLYLEGRLVDGSMQLEGTRPGEKGAAPVLHRIVWTPLPGGTLRQVWRSSADSGRTWQEVFDGHYTRIP
jgi:hypothetical protein